MMHIDLQGILNEIAEEVEPFYGKGKVADYIPALAKVPGRQFGMSVSLLNGQEYTIGDSDVPFSIQSISKVFTLVMAFREKGDEVWTRVGREPSGTPFNSLTQLETTGGYPRNPFINAGAHVVSDMLMDFLPNPRQSLLEFVRMLTLNEAIDFDPEVAESERIHGDRNRALAYYMKSFGNIQHDVDQLLDVYFHQCALSMSCRDLSRSLLFLANHGIVPHSGEQILNESRSKRLAALMLTCGLYDEAGEFAFRVGLPGKSGVGGGIVGIIPGLLSVAVWSPELDVSGNSVLAMEALERFTTKLGISVF